MQRAWCGWRDQARDQGCGEWKNGNGCFWGCHIAHTETVCRLCICVGQRGFVCSMTVKGTPRVKKCCWCSCEMAPSHALLWRQLVTLLDRADRNTCSLSGAGGACELKQGAHLDPKRNSLAAESTLML